MTTDQIPQPLSNDYQDFADRLTKLSLETDIAIFDQSGMWLEKLNGATGRYKTDSNGYNFFWVFDEGQSHRLAPASGTAAVPGLPGEQT